MCRFRAIARPNAFHTLHNKKKTPEHYAHVKMSFQFTSHITNNEHAAILISNDINLAKLHTKVNYSVTYF